MHTNINLSPISASFATVGYVVKLISTFERGSYFGSSRSTSTRWGRTPRPERTQPLGLRGLVLHPVLLLLNQPRISGYVRCIATAMNTSYHFHCDSGRNAHSGVVASCSISQEVIAQEPLLRESLGYGEDDILV